MRVAMMSLVLSGDPAAAQEPAKNPFEPMGNVAKITVVLDDRLSPGAEQIFHQWKNNQHLPLLRHPEQAAIVRRICKHDELRKSLVDSAASNATNPNGTWEDRKLCLELLGLVGPHAEACNALPGVLGDYHILLEKNDAIAYRLFPVLRATAASIGISQQSLDEYCRNPCDDLPRPIRQIAKVFVGPQCEFMPATPPPIATLLQIEQKHGLSEAIKYAKGMQESDLFHADVKFGYMCILVHFGEPGLKALREFAYHAKEETALNALMAITVALEEGSLTEQSSVQEFLGVVNDTKQCASRRDHAFRGLLKSFPRYHERILPVMISALGTPEHGGEAVNALRDALMDHPDDMAFIQDLIRIIRSDPASPGALQAARVFSLAGKSCPKASEGLQILGVEEWNTLPTEKEWIAMNEKDRAKLQSRFDMHGYLATGIGKSMLHADSAQRTSGLTLLKKITYADDLAKKGVHPDSRVRYSAVHGIAQAKFDDASTLDHLIKVAGEGWDIEVSAAIRAIGENHGLKGVEKLRKAYPDGPLVKYCSELYFGK